MCKRLLLVRRVLYICLFGAAAVAVAKDSWAPIDRAEWASSAPQVDGEAGAEFLSLEHVIENDDDWLTVTRCEARARVYAERGLQQFAKVEIPYNRLGRVYGLQARTIKPDGTVIELDPKDVYDRQQAKVGRAEKRVKSFSPPGLEVGCVVEYRYVLEEPRRLISFAQVFGADVPARRIRYRIKPYDGMRCLYFNCDEQQLELDEDGYHSMERTDVPALKAEPFSPPALHRAPSFVLYRTNEDRLSPNEHWKRRGIELFRTALLKAEPNRAMRAAMEKLFLPDDTVEQKLEKIYRYCRTEIKSYDLVQSDLTPEERRKIRDNRNAGETFRSKVGTNEEINILFTALARAAGFDARLARCHDRTDFLFSPKVTAPFALTDLVAAVKVGANWRFYDPGLWYLPFGVLHWANTDTYALISDRKDPPLLVVEGSAAETNTRYRTGEFTLNAEGALEGSVLITYTGLSEAMQKYRLSEGREEDWKETIEAELVERMPRALVSDVLVENARNPDDPLVIRYRLRVPDFADRVGTRLIFNPAVFQKGATPWFPAAERSFDVLLRHRFLDTDHISITPPSGFQLEVPTALPSVELGDLGRYRVTLQASRKTGRITYSRELAVRHILFEKTGYQALKELFDSIHQQDNYLLTYRRTETNVSQTAPSAPSRAGETQAKAEL